MAEQETIDDSVDDKSINDEKAKRTIFVGNVAFKVRRAAIKKLFAPYGKIEVVYKRSLLQKTEKLTHKMLNTDEKLKTTNTDAHFYVRFEDEETARKATELNGTVFEKRYIRVTLSTENSTDPKRSVFIGNLLYTVTEQSLMEHLIKELKKLDGGTVEAVHIVHDKATGLGRGFGFATLSDRESVAVALKIDGERFKGRPMRVTRVATKKKHLRAIAENSAKSTKAKTKAKRKRIAEHDLQQKLAPYTITKKSARQHTERQQAADTHKQTAAASAAPLSKKAKREIKRRQTTKKPKSLL